MIVRILIAINVIVYLWEMATGALLSDQALYLHGALVRAAVLQDGEWWRIVTSAFLHASFLHIGLNMLSLWLVGNFVEKMIGSPRFAVVYALSLLASGIGVVYFSPPDVVVLGASGAIYGVFGAIFAIGSKFGKRGLDFIKANIPILVLNLLMTFAIPMISKAAHLAGLVAGFLITLVIYFPAKQVHPQVVDAIRGEALESTYESPSEFLR